MIKNKTSYVKTILLLVITTLTVIGIKPSLAFSGSGSSSWKGNQYDTFMETTESISYNRGILARRLTNLENGKIITVFCAEHTEDFVVNVTNEGKYYQPTDEKVKRACKIAYMGWYRKYKDLVFEMAEFESPQNVQQRKDYAFTQQYIWEALGQSNATFIDSNIQAEYILFKANIDNNLQEIEKKPSFNNQTIKLNSNETKIVTDYNNVLKEYNSINTTINNITITHTKGENNLKITVPENCKTKDLNLSNELLKSWGLIKDETIQNNTTIYLEFKQGVQNQLYSLNYNSPVGLSFNLEINLKGKIELIKSNESGNLIDGSVFKITGPENYSQEINVKNGKTLLENLKIGTYFIKEIKAPKGYLINENTYNVEVKAGEISSIKIKNEKPTGLLIINKTVILRNDINKSIIDTPDYSKIVFKLIAKEDIKDPLEGKIISNKNEEIKTFSLDKNGKAEIKNLSMGTYELQEVKTIDGCVLENKKYEVKFEQKDSTTKIYKQEINIKNNTTLVEVSKKDITGTDEELIGAKLYIIDENNKIIDNWVTTNTPHKIEGLTAGKTYILREESAPYGYSVSEDIKFTVKNDNNIQKVEMKDAPILTTIKLEKIDSKTNNNIKEHSFIFGIFEDKECTKIINKIYANQEEGTATFENLRYGTYFIKELEAPIGYELSQKVVKIEIDEKGIYKDGELLEANNGIYNFKFYNLPLPEVQTGDNTNIVLYIFATILSCCTCLYLTKNVVNFL